jgi:uncharacterized YceG family protein
VSADDLKPPTDEFGRDDPDVIERERRRAERERRRQNQQELGAKVGKKRKAKKSRAAKAPEPEAPAPEAPVTEAPVTPPPAAAAKVREPRPGLGERAAAMRARIPSRKPREPREPRKPRAYGRRRIFALAGILVAVLLLWFLVALFQPFAGDGKGSGTVSVSIPEGASASQVADILDQNGVVSSSALFNLRLKLAGKSGDILPGSYVLKHGMSYSAAMDKLTGTSGEISVLIPEGLSRPQIAEVASKDGLTGDYNAASTSSPGFDPAAYGAKSPPSLEGFLFPATYKVDQGADVKELVQEQLTAFQQNIKGVDMSYAKKKNLTVYDVLNIASMVERETSSAKERPLVAAVIYNRLKQGIPLGIDATTRFETGNYDQPLTSAELHSNSPYNTRNHQGLPPTPIGNPGLASIKAAAAPAKVPYLYYVVDPGTCEHTFVNTLQEFNAAVAKYNAARDAAGGNSPTSC